MLSPLGTCALPPAVTRSKCGEVIRYIRSHPSSHNLATGVRFNCPSSIHRYLVACRPEAGCLRADPHVWYRGQEEYSCTQRAVLRQGGMQGSAASGLVAAGHTRAADWATVLADGTAAGTSQPHQAWFRNHFMRHTCERLAALPPTDVVGGAKMASVNKPGTHLSGHAQGVVRQEAAAATQEEAERRKKKWARKNERRTGGGGASAN